MLSLLFAFSFALTPPNGLVSFSVRMSSDPGPLESQRSPARTDDELAVLADKVVGSLARANEFLGVVVMARGGKTIVRKAVGFADREHGIPNRYATKFNIGSINKAFTSIAIHQLMKAGKLTPDDPIKKFLPSYPNEEARENVTVGHLFSMTSGIGDSFGERYQNTPKEKFRPSMTSLVCLLTSRSSVPGGRSADISTVDSWFLGLSSRRSPDGTTSHISGTTSTSLRE